jgi:hypothetical protein
MRLRLLVLLTFLWPVVLTLATWLVVQFGAHASATASEHYQVNVTTVKKLQRKGRVTPVLFLCLKITGATALPLSEIATALTVDDSEQPLFFATIRGLL